MKRIKTTFKRKGIVYNLINRTDKLALFSLQNNGKTIGYEVDSIKVGKHPMADEKSEYIPSDEQFSKNGIDKSFYNLNNAKEYYNILI